MPLDIDHSRRFATDARLRELVHAVLEAHDADEAHWLEWKSSLDLASKHGTCHVARAIIGMANRDVTVAGQAAEGYGYVVVGAEPGAKPPLGVPPVESHVLGSRLVRYLGLDGPRATSHNVEVMGVNVVVVEVMPPRPGDRPYWFESEAHDGKVSIRSGTVFVRNQSATAPADAGDMRRLLRRYSEGSGAPRLDVTVAASPDSLPVTVLSDDDIDTWLWNKKQRLLQSLPPADDDPVAQVNWLARQTRGFAYGLTGEDPRTEDEFRAEVDRYVNACRRSLRTAAEGAYFDAGHGRVAVTITNNTPVGFTDVEVVLHLEGDVEPVTWQPDDRLPTPPRPFGEPPPSPYAGPPPRLIPASDIRTRPPGPTFRVENSGSVTATWSGVDLRPLDTVLLQHLRVWTTAMPPNAVIRGEWRASAMNADGVCEGRVEVAVDGTLTLSDLVE